MLPIKSTAATYTERTIRKKSCLNDLCSEPVRFYSKWYCVTSGVDALARRFRLASNRYIVCESANVIVCQYQVMISNSLFEEINE